MQGKVKWFNDAKGYGFLVGDDHREYFFHRMEVLDRTQPLVPGDAVEFTVVSRPKGPTAIKVRLVTPATMPKEGN